MHDYLQRKKEKEQQNQHLLYLEKEKQTLYDLPLSANTGKLGLEEDIYVYITHKNQIIAFKKRQNLLQLHLSPASYRSI